MSCDGTKCRILIPSEERERDREGGTFRQLAGVYLDISGDNDVRWSLPCHNGLSARSIYGDYIYIYIYIYICVCVCDMI